MPDYEFIGKSQLSRGFSYPLGRSTLDSYLDQHSITMVTAVAYCKQSSDGRVINADYRGRSLNSTSHSLILWLNAVPSAIRHKIAPQFEEGVFPALATWISSFTDQSILRSQTDHQFEVFLEYTNDERAVTLTIQTDRPRTQRRLSRFRSKVRP